jgi:hypothetical protein
METVPEEEMSLTYSSSFETSPLISKNRPMEYLNPVTIWSLLSVQNILLHQDTDTDTT